MEQPFNIECLGTYGCNCANCLAERGGRLIPTVRHAPFKDDEILDMIRCREPKEWEFNQPITFEDINEADYIEEGNKHRSIRAADKLRELEKNKKDTVYADVVYLAFMKGFKMPSKRYRPTWYGKDYQYMAQHEYVSIYFNYDYSLCISISFNENDTQEEKDMIFEMVLSRLHKLFNCTFEREVSSGGTTTFKTEFEVELSPFGKEMVTVDVCVNDSLGCAKRVEIIEEELAESDAKNYIILDDGEVVLKSSSIKAVDGKLVKVKKKTTYDCAGDNS